jgi:pilus assembly protein CpaB
MKAKRKLIGFVAFGLLAVLAVALLITTRNNNAGSSESAEVEDVRQTTVLVAIAPIPRGTPADSRTLRDAVQEQTVFVTSLETGAVQSLLELDNQGNKKLNVDLQPNQQLTQDMFVDKSNPEVVAEVAIPPNTFQVSITLESERVLGGKLRPGDNVAILASYTDPARVTRIIAERVLVVEVESETPVASPDPATQATAPAPEVLETGFKGNVVVTVAVNTTQLEHITHAKEFGKVWLANQPKDTNVEGSQVRDIKDVLRAEVTQETSTPTTGATQ